MKRIMLATDFSERSDRALRRATLLARSAGAEILLVHAVDDDRPEGLVERELTIAEEVIAALAETIRTHDGVSCTFRIVLDDPFAGIVNVAADARPDLLVIGAHRRRVLRDVFFGTTAERTIRAAACPVLMANAIPAVGYQRTLLTTDLTDSSRSALDRYARLGVDPGARRTVLYLFGDPALRRAESMALDTTDLDDAIAAQRDDAARKLASFMTGIGPLACEKSVRRDLSTLSQGVLDAARECDADLIVLGTRGRRGAEKFFVGSVAEEVLRVAPIDVLAIPPDAPV
ncbi:MAG: universal stress protein [Tagaea sp.]|nr:universal stress protein [Tagaea sp.]